MVNLILDLRSNLGDIGGVRGLNGGLELQPSSSGSRSRGIRLDSWFRLFSRVGNDLSRRKGDLVGFALVGEVGAEDGSLDSTSIVNGLGMSRCGTGAYAPVRRPFCLTSGGGVEIVGGLHSRVLLEDDELVVSFAACGSCLLASGWGESLLTFVTSEELNKSFVGSGPRILSSSLS